VILVKTRVLVGYRVHITGLASKLEAHCKTHAHLAKAEDIQEVIDLLAKLIASLDREIGTLDSTQGVAISHLQAQHHLAFRIRSRCFTMMESYRVHRGRAKSPDFYNLLSELPEQLYSLARRLSDA